MAGQEIRKTSYPPDRFLLASGGWPAKFVTENVMRAQCDREPVSRTRLVQVFCLADGIPAVFVSSGPVEGSSYFLLADQDGKPLGEEMNDSWHFMSKQKEKWSVWMTSIFSRWTFQL